jgi:hypothetical protein
MLASATTTSNDEILNRTVRPRIGHHERGRTDRREQMDTVEDAANLLVLHVVAAGSLDRDEHATGKLVHHVPACGRSDRLRTLHSTNRFTHLSPHAANG